MASSNGGIIGKTNAPTSGTASGVWSLAAANLAIKDGKWPLGPFADTALKLDFDETTSLPSGITFTRATNGTYFNSSGTLTTASSGTARFDHRLEGGVWVNKGLLIEEQRTNSFQRSEEFNDAYWTKTDVTVTANNTTAPDGATTADKVLETSANGTHFIQRQLTITSTSASPTTMSVFVKGGLGRNLGFIQFYGSTAPQQTVRATFDLNVGTVTESAFNGGVSLGATIQDCGNGWYRITASGYTTQSSANHVFMLLTQNDSAQDSYVGDPTKGFYWWGAQLEVGAFPTSYIKTTTASVTRNADVASMTSTNFSSWYNATEGTVFWQGDLIALGKAVSGTSIPRAWSINDSTSNQRIFLNAEAQPSAGAATTTGTFAVIDGGAVQANFYAENPASNAIANFTYKYATVYKANDFAASVNGNSVQTDTSGTIPTVNRLQLGAEETANTLVLCGHIAKFYYWNTRKTNAFLQSITE